MQVSLRYSPYITILTLLTIRVTYIQKIKLLAIRATYITVTIRVVI